MAGLPEEVTEIVVLAIPDVTVCVTAGELLARNPVAPSYAAVIMCVPTASADVTSTACPLLSSVPVPKVVAPLLKVTLPAGVPETDNTVAVEK